MQEKQPIVRPARASWFCLQTQSKREHIAAAQLRQDATIDVFLPRIRYRRSTRNGMAWVTEGLFPGYLFARFELTSQFRLVQATRGVRGVVHFGDRWPTISDAAIAELRTLLGDAEIRLISPDLTPGDTVEVADGIFHGIKAIVTRVMPGRERVSVLLDFLGRQTTVELDRAQLVQNPERLRSDWKNG